MSNSANNPFDLGRSNVVYNQATTLVVITFFNFFMIKSSFTEFNNEDLLVFVLVISLFSIYIIFHSLKLNRVRISREYFHIDNILRHKKIETQKFEGIKIVSILPCIIKIIFKDGQNFLFSPKKAKSLKVMFLIDRETLKMEILKEIQNVIN